MRLFSVWWSTFSASTLWCLFSKEQTPYTSVQCTLSHPSLYPFNDHCACSCFVTGHQKSVTHSGFLHPESVLTDELFLFKRMRSTLMNHLDDNSSVHISYPHLSLQREICPTITAQQLPFRFFSCRVVLNIPTTSVTQLPPPTPRVKKDEKSQLSSAARRAIYPKHTISLPACSSLLVEFGLVWFGEGSSIEFRVWGDSRDGTLAQLREGGGCR